MEHRRSFLGVLLAVWQFRRALASPQGRAELRKQTPSAPAPSQVDLVEKALSACIASLKSKCRFPFSDPDSDGEPKVLKKLKNKCRVDFTTHLGGDDGPQCWKADKGKILRMAEWVGTFAQFMAETSAKSKEDSGKITPSDVYEGLKLVNGHCNLEGCGASTLRKYCENAVKDWNA